jgi:propane monooxygenase reductase subunit
MADTAIERPAVYYYGAREEQDLFHLDELQGLASALPGFRFVPALSDAEWDGETGLITDVVDRMEADLTDVDAYLCGPPPMVDAATELLLRRGVPESHIHFDKFTTTADAQESSPR